MKEGLKQSNLSAKLRLREFGQPISATKKLLRWLKLDGVSVGRPDEIEQVMARLAGRKQVGSYSPSKRSISIGKGSDLNILWHEAGHHLDRKKLLKSKPTWEREVKADNNAESLLRKFGGNIDHYQMPVDSRGIINRDVARRTPIAPISKQGSWIKKPISSPGRRSWEVVAYSDDGRPLFYDEFSTRAKLRLRELARGDFLQQVLGYSSVIPKRGAAEAVGVAGKLRHYRDNPVGKEIERVRKGILADPNLAQAYRYKDTPGLTVIDGYDEAHHFPKKSRQTKWVIDNLNKHAARGKAWKVSKGALGQPLVRAEGIDRIFSAKLRLRELAGKFGGAL